MERRKRALVLSGGGGRGAYACGVYKYLEEVGFVPDILVGTSIGALNAAAIASGKSASDLERLWLETRTRDVQRFWRPPPWHSLYDTSPWRKTIARFVDFERLNRSRQHVFICATAVEDGDLHIFDNRKDTLTPDHILASCSIPVIYPWTRIGETHYWDGAVMVNTPLGVAANAGAEEVVVVLLSSVGVRRQSLPRRPWEALATMLDLVLSATLEFDLKQLERINRLVEMGLDSSHRLIRVHLVFPSRDTSVLRIIRYDPRVSRELIDLGYRDARNALAGWLGI
jgi:NTE family protein